MPLPVCPGYCLLVQVLCVTAKEVTHMAKNGLTARAAFGNEKTTAARGELLGLNWEDIDWERDDRPVRRQISRING